MYSIKNMSFKDYIKDRTYLYFKPLNTILCCIKIKNPTVTEQKCNCPIDIFTDNIIKTLKKQDFSYRVEYGYEHIITSKVKTVNILSLKDIELIRHRYA